MWLNPVPQFCSACWSAWGGWWAEMAKGKFDSHLTPFVDYCSGFHDGPQLLLLSCLGPLKPNSAFLRCCGCEPDPRSPLSFFSSKFGLLRLPLTRNPPQTSLEYGKLARSARSSCWCVSLRNGTPLVFDVHWVALQSYFCFNFSLQPSSAPGSENVVPREPLVRSHDV